MLSKKLLILIGQAPVWNSLQELYLYSPAQEQPQASQWTLRYWPMKLSVLSTWSYDSNTHHLVILNIKINKTSGSQHESLLACSRERDRDMVYVN